jgi:hypothetical protein
MADYYEHGNKSLGSIKDGEFLDYLRTVSLSRRLFLHVVSYYQIISNK